VTARNRYKSISSTDR